MDGSHDYRLEITIYIYVYVYGDVVVLDLQWLSLHWCDARDGVGLLFYDAHDHFQLGRNFAVLTMFDVERF